MGKRWLSLIGAVIAATINVGPLIASNTTTYTYDALGRLVTTAVSGGPSGGTQTSATFDPAGNRSTYIVSGVPLPPAFSINNVSATEGAALVFTITKTGFATDSLSVNYATSNGTATSPADYTATSGTVTFLPSETSKTISVPTIDDTLVEGNETLSMALSGASSGASIATATGTGTINDNDVPSFSIGNAVAVNEGAGMTFTVTKTGGGAGGSYSVNYASASGTASSGTDFTATSGTLTFLSSETSKTITVATASDTIFELGETVMMNLSSPTGGATITSSQGSGTINNTSAPPSFSIGNASAVAEGGTLTFTVTKTGATTLSHSVNYGSASGTATSGTDFTPVSGMLTFLPTETTKTISVATIDDSSFEPDETVLVNLSSPTGGASIAASQGSGTIANNDVANLPPVANPDTTSFNCSQFKVVNVVANDTDPENNTPLTVVSVTDLSGAGYASLSGTTSVRIGAGNPGTFYFNYVVSDSLGATSTGLLTATVTGKSGICLD